MYRRAMIGAAALALGIASMPVALAQGGAPDRAAETPAPAHLPMIKYWHASKLSAPQFDVTVQNDVMVPMRDGVELSTDIYRPTAPGRYPVLLSRTPYNNNTAEFVAESKFYASRGYVVIAQDVRGKYDSGGQYSLFSDEANDGYDTDEWIGQQAWSNGRIGTLSGSYGGYTGLVQGIGGSQYLKAMAGSVTTGDIFNGWIWNDGALFLGFAYPWGGVVMDGRGMQYSGAVNWADAFRHLPLATIDTAAGHVNESFRELLRHPRADDPFWKGISFENRIADIKVPMLVIDGWYDLFLRGALDDQIKVAANGATPLARAQKRIIIGPWSHDTGVRVPTIGAPTTGPDRTIDFGPDAEVDKKLIYLRWNDHWLKGIDNGVDREPPVTIFVMGDNVWRFENEWPLARTHYTPYYLASGGHANSAAGDGLLSTELPKGAKADHFTYDPADPVPSAGGNICCSSVPAGPWDQSKVEARGDVLVFTTPVLDKDIEVTGPLMVKLFAASSAPDTDWTAKLVDVHPDGYAQNIQDGIIRARYRAGTSAPAALLTPGKVYAYDINLWATSNVFKAGHRIRVEISSSNFPRFDRNLNTGEDPVTGTRMAKAQQSILHSARYPSHILLPIIPR